MKSKIKEKPKGNSQIQRRDWWLPEGKGWGMGEWAQLYGDGWELDLLW